MGFVPLVDESSVVSMVPWSQVRPSLALQGLGMCEMGHSSSELKVHPENYPPLVGLAVARKWAFRHTLS